MKHHIKFETTLINDKVQVSHLLTNLRKRQSEWGKYDRILQDKVQNLDPTNKVHVQIGTQLSISRRRIRLHIVDKPLEVCTDTIQRIGYETLRKNLSQQFSGLSSEDRKMWLNHFLFIMTPDLKRLSNKIQNIREWRAIGQQRNFLLGGDSGMGKTTCLDWFTYKNLQQVSLERNIVPVIKVDAPLSNLSPKPLFQRILLECGCNYLTSDREEELLEKITLYFQLCDVEILIIDEIEHIKRDNLKRRVLEVSNRTRGVPIICASCKPTNWLGTDVEIRGRWNDYLELKPYTGDRLRQLLAFIELLLPFSKPSNLAKYQIEVKKGKRVEYIDGPAKLIERWTGGILRDVMVLIIEATTQAIDTGKPSITPALLHNVWNNIQDNPI